MEKIKMEGIVFGLGEVKSGEKNGKAWSYRDLLVDVGDEKGNNVLSIGYFGDKLGGVLLGDRVRVCFEIKGNEYNGKHYVKLSGWDVEVLSKGSVPAGDSLEDKIIENGGLPLENKGGSIITDELPF